MASTSELIASHAQLLELLETTTRQLSLYARPDERASLQLIQTNNRALAETRRLFCGSRAIRRRKQRST